MIFRFFGANRRPRHELHRDDLMKAAKNLPWKRGYEATSPGDIQEASGAGQGSFYHHFDGELALAVAALEEVSAEMCAPPTLSMDAEASGRDRVTRKLRFMAV